MAGFPIPIIYIGLPEFTLSPIIMEVEIGCMYLKDDNYCIRSIFHFHDYGKKGKTLSTWLAFRMSSHSKNLKGQGIFLGIPVVNHHFCSAIINLSHLLTRFRRPKTLVTRLRDRWPKKKHLWVFTTCGGSHPHKKVKTGVMMNDTNRKNHCTTLRGWMSLKICNIELHQGWFPKNLVILCNSMITTKWGLSTKIVGTYQSWTFFGVKPPIMYNLYGQFGVAHNLRTFFPYSYTNALIVANAAAV